MNPYMPQAPLVQVIRGPILLMVIGGLFALDHFTEYRIGQTWPVLLIVVGLFMLLGRMTRQHQVVLPAPPPPQQPGGMR